MRIEKFDNYYVVRLQKNEEIITALQVAARNERIKSGFFFGLGVGKDLVLGYFDGHNKSYIKKAFAGEYEFTSLAGNIAQIKNEIAIHCHVTITNDKFAASGGHLFQGLVPATLEIIVLPFKKTLKRKKDAVTGLNLIDIGEDDVGD